MPLDPQVQTFIDQIAALGQPPMQELSVEEQRGILTGLGALGQRPEGVSVSERTIPGPAGDLTIRVYRDRDAGDAEPGLVFFHGGGFVIGSLDSHEPFCADLARGAACTVVSVDYRLAPECPYPAALEDGFAALAWVRAHASEVGIDPQRIAVGGDSAGGNVAAMTAIRARDEGGPTVVAQLLVYPWADLSCLVPSVDQNAEGYLLEKEHLLLWRGHYAPGHEDWAALSPSGVEDLDGLPPAVVVTAEFDPLRDDGDAYAGRLAEAGVPVTHLRYAGLVHAFVHLTGVSEACRQAVDEMGAELGKLLHA